MSANVVAVTAPSVDAVVRVSDTGASPSGPTAGGHPTDWSFQWAQWVVEPIGSNTTQFCGDGFGAVP